MWLLQTSHTSKQFGYMQVCFLCIHACGRAFSLYFASPTQPLTPWEHFTSTCVQFHHLSSGPWFPFLSVFPINKHAPGVISIQAPGSSYTLECLECTSLFLRWTDGLQLTWMIGKHTLTKNIIQVHCAGTMCRWRTRHSSKSHVFFPSTRLQVTHIWLSRPPQPPRWTNCHIPSPYTVRKISQHESCLP